MLAGKSHFSRVFLSLITVLLFTGTGTSRILNNTGMENATQLTVSCINCNSLNMSAVGGQSQLCKIYGIAKLRTDIIFMSDIRLSTKNKISCSNEMTKKFSNTPYGSYDFYFNSSKNKRGVAILVKKNLNFAVLDRRDDQAENYLLLSAELAGKKVTLGCVYGPNSYDADFFANLERDIVGLGNSAVLLAGDWNCTYATEPVERNIDCINMTNTPNERHSILMRSMADRLLLVDPYRCLHPNKKEYTYIPRAVNSKNRSRIDFFLTSTELLQKNFECKILPALQGKMFDHRACTLTLDKKYERWGGGKN
jgi:exonuclease III